MDALIDTNVLINYVTNREDPYKEASIKVMELCSEGRINGSMAFHTLSTLWYVLRRFPDHIRREWLSELVELLTVSAVGNTKVRQAIEMNDFRDFEDCLQYQCAKKAGASYIITCNVKDYQTVHDISVITPEQAIQIATTGLDE